MGPAEPERLLAGRYQLHTIIGRGGMGVVWRARDQLLSRDVAVKEIVWPPHLDTGERDIARRRALREAQMAARLSHPNVVAIYDIVEEDGRPWLVMELVPYRSLRDAIVADGPLPPARAAQVGLGILAALRAAHHAGVLHRDVKPANVLLAPGGRVVLTDFGIARAADSPALTSSGVLVGSPSYISPERARGEGAAAAGDMWALGACLYAAVEGRPPFERDGALASLTAVVTDEPDPPNHAGPLWPIISGLLRKEPAERLGADAVEEMLHRVSDGKAPSAERKRPAKREQPAERAPLAAAPPAGLPLAELPLAGPAAEPESPAGAESPAAPGVAAAAEWGTAPVSPAGRGEPTGPVPAAAADDPTGPVPAVAAASVPQDPGPPAAPGDLSPESPPPGNLPAETGQPDSARPDSARPDSARPDSAQPDSAQPDSARPAEPGPGAHRRRVAVLAAAATGAVVAGAVVAIVLAATGSPQHPSAHAATSTPRASATRSVPASSPASPSSPATASPASSSPGTAPGGTSALPAGYQRFRNSTGFSIGVPTGWQTSHDGHYVYIRDPANSGIFLLIDQSTQPQPNALADWQQQAASRQNSYPGYHLIRLQAVRYAQAQQAADWEFTYNRGGIEVHILNRNILANANHAYALYWSVPETEWNADYHYFQAFAATFQPAGVNQG